MACTSKCVGVFVWAGTPGAAGDAHTWNQSTLKERVESGELGQSPPLEITRFSDDGYVCLHPYFIADAAFGLTERLMKAHPGQQLIAKQRAFNAALNTARNVVERAFGQLKGRWRILLHGSEVNNVRTATHISLVCCALHNWLVRKGADEFHEEGDIVPRDLHLWHDRNVVRDFAGGRGNEVRNALTNYMWSRRRG